MKKEARSLFGKITMSLSGIISLQEKARIMIG